MAETVTNQGLVDICASDVFRLKARCDANENFAIGKPFAMSLIWDIEEQSKRIAALESELRAAKGDAERYWPFVEMVAKDRLPPTMQDVADAMTMHAESKRRLAAAPQSAQTRSEGEGSTHMNSRESQGVRK